MTHIPRRPTPWYARPIGWGTGYGPRARARARQPRRGHSSVSNGNSLVTVTKRRWGGGGSNFPEKNITKVVRFNVVISVTRGWVGIQFPKKAFNTLTAPNQMVYSIFVPNPNALMTVNLLLKVVTMLDCILDLPFYRHPPRAHAQWP